MFPEDPISDFERIPRTPPMIAPVPSHVKMPLWSVMIPVYNCLGYLEETLECILAQAPGPEAMQIVVVDDCSTDGDVRALVQRIGRNRVDYYRQPRNVGSLRNFETCLNRSLGQWVHMLHGDDRVLPGFYAEVEQLFAVYSEAGAAFTNLFHDQTVLDSAIMETESGLVKDFLVRNAQKLIVQPPAMVVKRAVYEQLGGFFAVHYGEDWEMWTRIAAHFPIAYSPKRLAHYRYMNADSITQNSIISGQNVHDIIKVIDIMQQYLPVRQRQKAKSAARLEYATYCANMAYHLSHANFKSALLQAKGALQLSKDPKVYLLLLKYAIKYAVNPKTWLSIV